jgi:hypothetical protein
MLTQQPEIARLGDRIGRRLGHVVGIARQLRPTHAGQQSIQLCAIEAEQVQIAAGLLEPVQQLGQIVLLPLAVLIVISQEPFTGSALIEVGVEGRDGGPAQRLGGAQAHVARDHLARREGDDRPRPQHLGIGQHGSLQLLEPRLVDGPRVVRRGVQAG